MKFLEKSSLPNIFIPQLPVVVRIDGRSFHSFTKGLKRPYDERLSSMMVQTTKDLVKETGALCGYTQSDEISLLLYSDNMDSQIFFDGKSQKIISQTAAIATQSFCRQLWIDKVIPEKEEEFPLFDSRAFALSTKSETARYFMWREIDATKNSITMAASCYYSHQDLHNKTGKDKQEMLWLKKVNWNNYPSFFKRGTFVKTCKEVTTFSPEEIALLPEKHNAKKDPNYKFERQTVKEVELSKPFLSLDPLTRINFLFNKECINV